MSDDDFDEPDFDSDSTVDGQKESLEQIEELAKRYHPQRLQYIEQNKIQFSLSQPKV